MKTEKPNQEAGSVDGTLGILLGRPTVAANAGTDLNRKLLRAFNAADVSNAKILRLSSLRECCRLTGLFRTTFCELIECKVIQAARAQRGMVLIIRQSQLDYLRRLEAEQCGEAALKGGGQ